MESDIAGRKKERKKNSLLKRRASEFFVKNDLQLSCDLSKLCLEMYWVCYCFVITPILKIFSPQTTPNVPDITGSNDNLKYLILCLFSLAKSTTPQAF